MARNVRCNNWPCGRNSARQDPPLVLAPKRLANAGSHLTAMPNGSSFTSYGWAVCLWALVIAFQVYLPLYIAILADFLQYGYHISVLNQIQGVLTCKVTTPHTFPATPRLADCIPMSDLTFSLLTAIFTIGGLAGSLVANLVMDSSGRRGSNRICAIFMAVGTALMGLSNSLILLLLGR